MTTDAPDGRADPIDAIFKSLDDSNWGRRHLPRLVSLLSHDRARVRMGAGWAVAYVAAEHPDSATFLVRRLGDRLTDEDVSPTVEQAFLGVAMRYPAVVEAELPDVVGSETARRFERRLGTSMLRAEYGGGERNRDVGRFRLPRGDPDDGQQVYTDHGEVEDDVPGSDPTASHDEEDAAEAGSRDGGGRVRPARELWADSDHLATISRRCRFDDLAVTAGRRRGRYADVYRTRAEHADEDRAVSLCLFHDPDGDVTDYVADLDETLHRWDRVDDVDGVRTLLDWGRKPRPWALVDYADKDLRDRARFTADEALWNARHLAISLAHVHENGVVHAGVDPGNVSYYENLLDPQERQIPMLTNVGLLSVVRRYFDPTGRLDPRFAAPEYFDRGYGRIDHASDIYGLGAVYYYLFTGRPPYHGDYAAVRDAVLSPTPPEPSAVADVPAGIDEVLAKAMATEKLHRYDGVTHLAADVRAVAEREGIGELYDSYGRGVTASAVRDDDPAVGERPQDDADSTADGDPEGASGNDVVPTDETTDDGRTVDGSTEENETRGAGGGRHDDDEDREDES